jgi:integrase
MADPYLKRGKWYARIKDGRGRWRSVALSAARSKGEARRLQREMEWSAERQRQGLEPIRAKAKMTVAELAEWWLEHRCPKRSLKQERSRVTKHVIDSPLGNRGLAELDTAAIEDHLRAMEKTGAKPASINHVRKALRTIISRAAKAGLWVGPNPVDDVERRAVPGRKLETLRAEEVPLLLAQVPDQWRGLFACAVYLGLRKGELFALRKTDIDLRDRTIAVAASHGHDTTKGGDRDVLPIPAPLLPYLREALKNASTYLFPGSDGERRPESAKPELVLRHALARAELVLGWDHVCRRCTARGERHSERAPSAELRKCPRCGMRLWPKAIPRPMRFHDLRHSTATILLRAGVDLHRVQRILRHADVRLTVQTYGHLVVEDLRDAADRIAPPRSKFATGLLPEARADESRRDQRRSRGPDSEGLVWREQQESNLRPLASEANALSN